MTHLIYEYAELEEEDIQEINRKIKEPISGKTLFKEFDQEAVAVQNPYFPAQIVSMAYSNIDKCGLYQHDCRDWSRKPRSENTWVKFKARFVCAFKETRKSSKTSRTEGYVAHEHAAQANA